MHKLVDGRFGTILVIGVVHEYECRVCSFVACVAELFFFGVFDPDDLTLFGEPLGASRTTIYSVGFFLFWAFAAGSSALTCYLRRASEDVNR